MQNQGWGFLRYDHGMTQDEEVISPMIEKFGPAPDGIEELESSTHSKMQELVSMGATGWEQLIPQIRLEVLIEMLCELKVIDYWDYQAKFHGKTAEALADIMVQAKRKKLLL